MAGKMGKGGELVSSKEDGMVSVPSKGSISSGVGVAARGLSVTGLCIISIGDVGSTLVAVVVLGGPGLPGQTCGHPVDWQPGHHAALELNVLERDDQEPGPGRGDCHKGGEDEDLHLPM